VHGKCIHADSWYAETTNTMASLGCLPSRFLDYIIIRPLNHLEKREKVWYNSYGIKLQGGLDHDICLVITASAHKNRSINLVKH